MKRWTQIPLACGLAGALTAVLCPAPDRPAAAAPPAEAEWPVFAPPEVLEPLPDTAAMQLRARAKDRIARDVVAGRRSLPEAAALFGALNRMPPVSPDLSLLDSPLSLPARTDEERLCRQVVEWVKNLLRPESPASAEPAVARLEAEFREELCRHGEIRLPDPPSPTEIQEVLELARQAIAAPGPSGMPWK